MVSGHSQPRFIIGTPGVTGGFGSTLNTNSKRPLSPTKSIYDLVRQDIKMPEGLLFRGKYVGKSRNSNQPTQLKSQRSYRDQCSEL